MKLIGYTCPYVPVELLSAAGFQPYCLLHGDYELMQRGTEYAGEETRRTMCLNLYAHTPGIPGDKARSDSIQESAPGGGGALKGSGSSLPGGKKTIEAG